MSVSCRIPSRIRHALVALTMVGIGACAGDRPTGPDASILAAKGGGGGGPKVTDADPNSAPQGTTLDIRVIGSGFEGGSVVTLLLAGKSTPKILTISTTFVDGNNLIANVTIAFDAEITLYDIEVAPPRGRPGVGSELFSVKEKGKPDEDVFNYTITDLGTEGGVSDINDAGLIVGSAPSGGVAFRAARWTDTGGGYSMQLLGDGVWESGPGSWAEAVNGSGAAVGVVWVDADYTDRAALWRSSGGVELLPLLDPADLSQAYGINGAGQISGQSYTRGYETARAVRWEPDGSVTDLGVLPDYNSSIGWAINNLGWVGGSSRPANSEASEKRQHAVLWIDDGSGQISDPLDLHPGAEIQSIVKGIGDAADGKVYVAGTLDSRPVVWVVDVAAPHGMIEHVLEEVGGGAGAVNAAGEVVVSGPAVWTRFEEGVDLVDPLPSLFSKRSCSSSGKGINNVGTVVGGVAYSRRDGVRSTRSSGPRSTEARHQILPLKPKPHRTLWGFGCSPIA